MIKFIYKLKRLKTMTILTVHSNLYGLLQSTNPCYGGQMIFR
uniref:Uncharacterized protein n=1 Tax=Anguilla anguilla TaxID=7936 RepID=A0A0E9V3D2_ANGAN